MTQRIVTIGRLIAPYVSDTYAVLDAAAAVDNALPATPEPVTIPEFGHEVYVEKAMRDPQVLGHMLANRKMEAIKRLRLMTRCGLKEAKDALESQDVLVFVGQMREAYGA